MLQDSLTKSDFLHELGMSEPVQQCIRRIPQLSDADISCLQQALDKEKCQRRDEKVLRLFRKKCISAGRNSEDDEISDFSEDSPGEFFEAIQHGVAKFVRVLQEVQTKRVLSAFQTWKDYSRRHKFSVSLKRPVSAIDID